jgi:hypothetical protein
MSTSHDCDAAVRRSCRSIWRSWEAPWSLWQKRKPESSSANPHTAQVEKESSCGNERSLAHTRHAKNVFGPSVLSRVCVGALLLTICRRSADRKGRAAVISPQVSDQLRRLLQLECHERQGIELDASAEISVQSVSMGRNGPHVWDECDIIRWAGPGLPRAFTQSHPPSSLPAIRTMD